MAIPYSLYKQETAGADKDVLTAITAVAAAGFTPSAADGIFYVIEIDDAEMEAALAGPLSGTLGQFAYLQLSFTNGANSVIASAVAVLSGRALRRGTKPDRHHVKDSCQWPVASRQ